jgi:hypothetical protein
MERKQILIVVVLIVALSLAAIVNLILPKDTKEPEQKAQTSAQVQLSFQQLTERLEIAGWNVSDKHEEAEGTETIVVFYDVHMPLVEQKNYQRILELEKIWDLEVVNLENIAGSPSSTENKAMRARPSTALIIEPELVLDLSGTGKAEELPQLPAPSGKYDELFSSSDFEAYGFEDPEYFAKIAPAAIGEATYDILLEVVMRKVFMPVRRNEKTVYQVLELIEVQDYLNSQFEGYPVFDPDKLSMKEKGLVVLSEKDSAYVGECAFRHRAWMLKHACYPRNKIAVERSLARMRERSQTRGALVIGGDHLKKHNLVDGKTVLDWLKENKVSYLLVTPE